jgi:hypothetical protein
MSEGWGFNFLVDKYCYKHYDCKIQMLEAFY